MRNLTLAAYLTFAPLVFVLFAITSCDDFSPPTEPIVIEGEKVDDFEQAWYALYRTYCLEDGPTGSMENHHPRLGAIMGRDLPPLECGP